MITNGLAEEHSHSIQAKFYAILTKNGNYTRIFVGDTFGQSVSKVMTHLTVFGEFSSIPNLGKTSPPPHSCYEAVTVKVVCKKPVTLYRNCNFL